MSRPPGAAASEESAVAAANLEFYRALQARELKAMERVWLHEESASCVHPGWHRLDGWAEIRRSWESIFTNSRPWSVSCEDERITVLGDLAWVCCIEVILPFGAEEPGAAGRMQATNLFLLRDGRWLMTHHHASPSPDASAEEEEETVH
jgi:ketosteroid isomerase-like protein